MPADRHLAGDTADDPTQHAPGSETLSDAGTPDSCPTPCDAADQTANDETWTDTTGTDAGEAAVAHPTEAEDTAASVRTASAGTILGIWGADLDDVEPGMTLKGPHDARAQLAATLPPAEDDAPLDVRLEGYELLEVLGAGGVGVVYQAIQKSIDRKIAIKMIKPGVSANADRRNEFLSEAMITGKLDHPNIVPIHDLGTTEQGQPYYTMKMVRGTPWGDMIDDTPLSENLRVLLDVCDAVSFAHSKNVIHRDLKPDNVMLGEFGEVQLMDWGLGAPVSRDVELTHIPKEQAAGGTPAFMAPEMVTGVDGPVGIHSDVYLLGGILYRIVTGKPPHAGKRTLECLENAANNVIQPTDRSGALVDIALKAMQAAPIDRYASVASFKQALLDYQAHAASINLCQRSSGDLQQAHAGRDYDVFARALFGFREALRLWEDNPDARAGIVETQLQYARCAFEKGDLDLAASTLDSGCAAHQTLAVDIATTRGKRDAAKRRLKLFRTTALSLTVAVVLILTIASIWIYRAKQQAVTAKEAAVTAQQAETEQRQLAETAKAKAQEEEARAVQALADLEKAYKDLIEAQEQEKRAVARAEASDIVATETRDELAKTGMLLDNSWWVFDAETARRKQSDAATAAGTPGDLTLALSDDTQLELVLIPPGDFVMGSPPTEEERTADEHLHRVRHTHAFYLGKFEVTEAQWLALTGRWPTSAPTRDADPTLPVTGISAEQIAQELLPALQKHAPDGYEFRLPTEAEWEYACRAGQGAAYYTGDDQDALEAAGWFVSNSNRKVQPVGGKTPNAWGLYDMHGNIGEVCADEYATSFYLESATDDPVAAPEGERLVVRGGSVLNTAEHCRSAYRSYVYHTNQYEFLGIRVALVPTRDDGGDIEANPAENEPTQP